MGTGIKINSVENTHTVVFFATNVEEEELWKYKI